jgi:hypothetical protein
VNKKALKDILGLSVLSLFFCFSGCIEETIIEVTETHAVTDQSLQVCNELLSTYDIIEDFVSSADMFMKKDESLLPPEVVVTVIDAIYTDGDGVEVVLDFGELGAEPHGLLCKDKKYRAGKVRITADKPYGESGAKVSITFLEDNPFYSGSGDNMMRIDGDIIVHRIEDNKVNMHCTSLQFYDGEEEISLVADLMIEKTNDAGAGIIDDELSFSGEVLLETVTGQVKLTTISPLKKKYTLDCAQHIIAGHLDVDQSNSLSKITVDFDPVLDEACDNKVSITINGKTLFYEY